MAPTRRTLAAVARQKGELGRYADTRTNDLVASWARAWDEISADLADAIDDLTADPTKVSALVRRRKAAQALQIASAKLLEVSRTAGATISDDARQLVELAATHQAQLVLSQLPDAAAGLDLLRVDAQQMDAIAHRATETITRRALTLHADAEQVMRRELLRSAAVGSSPRVAASRMLSRVQGAFDGGLTRAMVIARTEQVDAYRAAATRWQDTNADVLAGWQWVATLGPRTCSSCISHHGEIHRLDEPGPLDHPQGRCARTPITKSWRELGFDVDEPDPVIRPGDGELWFNAQPPSVQRQVMGDAHFEAWQEGRYSADRWSVRRSTDGWRDSYHVGTPLKGAPAPDPSSRPRS
jgi:hypothetical protein